MLCTCIHNLANNKIYTENRFHCWTTQPTIMRELMLYGEQYSVIGTIACSTTKVTFPVADADMELSITDTSM